MNNKRSRKCLGQVEPMISWSFDDVLSINNLSFANLTLPLFCRANIKHMTTSTLQRFDILCIKVNIMTQRCSQPWCSPSYTLPTSEEHFHDHIISPRGVWVHKTSLIPAFLNKMSGPSQKGLTNGCVHTADTYARIYVW